MDGSERERGGGREGGREGEKGGGGYRRGWKAFTLGVMKSTERG